MRLARILTVEDLIAYAWLLFAQPLLDARFDERRLIGLITVTVGPPFLLAALSASPDREDEKPAPASWWKYLGVGVAGVHTAQGAQLLGAPPAVPIGAMIALAAIALVLYVRSRREMRPEPLVLPEVVRRALAWPLLFATTEVFRAIVEVNWASGVDPDAGVKGDLSTAVAITVTLLPVVYAIAIAAPRIAADPEDRPGILGWIFRFGLLAAFALFNVLVLSRLF